ncbi:MAG: hypothetical protein QOH88_2639 [Verrucomicrobiota bacterium]|jgi:hypothetical protein
MSGTPYLPDDEAEVDREIHIEKMKRELDEIADGEVFSGSFEPVSPKMEEAFLEQVLAFERAEFGTNFNRLVQQGLALPPAAELDDAVLAAKLEEVIRELGLLRCFLYQTDHLSDRELYDWLWSIGLRDETPDSSEMPGGAWHTSPIGAGSDEDMAIWLKYYADDNDRQRWQRNFPNDPMPARESPPFDRDNFLRKRRIL